MFCQPNISRLVNRMFAALFPHSCALCGLNSALDMPLCARCRKCLPSNVHCCTCCALPLPRLSTPGASRLCPGCQLHKPAFNRVIAPWQYDEHMAYLIQRWKFHGERRLSALLAALWLEGATDPSPVDVILPVPLHWRRLWRRGFNQSELLCHQLQRRNQPLRELRLETGFVSRQRATLSQSGLETADRERNLRAAFRTRRNCAGLSFAIVDDVMTTGSTVSALASCLLDAGATSVEVWCIARTPAPPI